MGILDWVFGGWMSFLTKPDRIGEETLDLAVEFHLHTVWTFCDSFFYAMHLAPTPFFLFVHSISCRCILCIGIAGALDSEAQGEGFQYFCQQPWVCRLTELLHSRVGRWLQTLLHYFGKQCPEMLLTALIKHFPPDRARCCLLPWSSIPHQTGLEYTMHDRLVALVTSNSWVGFVDVGICLFCFE